MKSSLLLSVLRALGAELLLGLRRLLRGPLAAVLPALAVLCLIVLPGTDPGALVAVGYGTLLFWAFLIVCALWCGGTAYALDRERRRLTLTFAKPVSRRTLWLGRTLGTLAPLSLAVLLVGLLLSWRSLPEGRTVQSPALPDLDALARTELVRLRSLNRVPAGVSESRLLRAVRDDLRTRSTELGRSTPRSYTFAGLPAGTPVPAPVTFRLAGAPFLGAKDALALEVTAACDGERVTLPVPRLLDSGFSLSLPETLLRPGKPVTVTLRRTDRNDGSSVVYRERTDLALLLPGQSAGLNLAVFCGMLWITLAMAAALGTALGCWFSLPVTLFVGTLAVLSFTSASLSPDTMVADEIASLWARVSTAVSSALAAPFREWVACDPLRRLLDGEALTLGALGSLLLRTLLPWLTLCFITAALSPVRDEDL